MASELERRAAAFRAALLAHDRETALVMAREYRAIKAAIEVDLARVVSQIVDARAAGIDVTPGWLWKQQRYQALLAQAERQMALFARDAGLAIQRSGQIAASLGAEHATALLDASLGTAPPGAVASFATLPDEAIAELVGSTQPHAPLGGLLAQFAPDATEAVRGALIEGLALGQHPSVMARRIRDELGGGLTRALLIARTETMRAYREAARQTFQANDHLVKGWVWYAQLAPSTCSVCWSMHGTKHPLSEPMGSHPACRCVQIPDTKSWKELGFNVPDRLETSPRIEPGPAVFRRQSPDVQRRILGKAKHEAYQRGEFDLPDVVKVTRSPVWGTGRAQKSLREMGLRGKPVSRRV